MTIRTSISSSSLWCISLLSGAAIARGQNCAAAPAGLAAQVTFDESRFRAHPNRVAGQVGQALSFDGKSQFVELAAEPAFQPGEGDFSVEIWVRTAVKDRIRNLADFRNNAPRGWLLYVRHQLPGFQVADGGVFADAVAGETGISDGRWHHIVGVAKRLPPQPPVIYVDGRGPFKGQKNIPLANLDHNTALWFGRHHANAFVHRDDYYFNGALDEFALYKRALTAADVQALYRAGKAGKCKK